MSVHEFRQRMKDPARSKRTGREPNEKNAAFELPETRGSHSRVPIVKPPEPETWLEPEARELPPIVVARKEKLDDVTSNAIGLRMLECLDTQYDEAVLLSGGALHLYRDGVFEPIPEEEWLDPAFQRYHNTESYQQEQGKDAGIPWFFNPTNLAAAKKALFTKLRERQVSDRDPIASSPALAVFGRKTLVYDRSHRSVSLEDNAPEWRATFAYPFELEEGAEPEWFLRILREDVFHGVEENERELRIERIRQQMGMAMLGCQAMTNLHSVVIMKGQGHDGKSTILELLQLCMPPDSCTTMNPQDLSRGTGDGAEGRARLRGKYAVICDDVSEQSMRDSSHYKTATAYGKVAGRFFGSGRNSFEFAPRATWFLACQELWKTEDKTRGFQRRHCIIEFPNSIDEAHADRSLARRLYSLEREKVVSWACDAAIALLRGGSLAKPECSERLMREWMRGDDDVLSFIESCTRPAAEGEAWTPIENGLYARYLEWCQWAGIHPKTAIGFAKRASALRGYVSERSKVNGERLSRANRVLI